VHRVGLDVLVEELGRRLQAEPAKAGAYRLLGAGEVISNTARCPTIPPRNRRCRPISDIRLTVARVVPGSLSRYAP